MKKNLLLIGVSSPGLATIAFLQSFTVFPEYFLSISVLYLLVVLSLITYNIYGLMLQKAVSECIALMLFMTCYLLFNDDLITLSFRSFHNSVMNDYLSYIAKLIICFFSAIYFLLISDSLKEQKLNAFEYLLVLLFCIIGLMLMCSSNDLLTAYLSLEFSSLALYILASFRKTSSYSIESGLKYFIIGAVSSAFFLLGSSFIYLCIGAINFADFALFCGVLYEDYNIFIVFHPMLPSVSEIRVYVLQMLVTLKDFNLILNSINIFRNQVVINAELPHFYLSPVYYTVIDIGLALILFSLFIKLACAPFHLWSLDVYEGSPTSSSFFFAAITKLSIFVLLIRLCYNSFPSDYECWYFYFFLIGVFSVFVGSFGGLKQRKLKTLLAYSSITNMNYALLALGVGIEMLFVHLAVYMISGLCVWSILLLLRLKTKKFNNKYNKELGDLVLLQKSNPALAFALLLTMFSIAGIPPMIGFSAKMGIFLSLIQSKFYVFVIASAVCSVTATFYYIRIIKVLYFENLSVGKLYYPIKNTKTIILSGLIFLLLLLFVNPSILYILSYYVTPELGYGKMLVLNIYS